MNNVRRQLFLPFQPRRPFIPPYNWFPRAADYYADAAPNEREPKERDSTQFQSEANIVPLDNLTISSLHVMTKNIINTLQTIDKSLDLAVKILAILDNYQINLSSFSSKGSVAGSNMFKMITGFVNKVDIKQLERAADILQSPLIVDLLTSGFNFDPEDNNGEAIND
jgi:hypothetical protein